MANGVRRDNTSPKVNSGVIDYASAMQRLGGDRDLFCELAQMFTEDGPSSLTKLEQAINAGDAAMTRRMAHTLKGLAANFGARQCVSSAQELELLGKAGELDDAPRLFATLRDYVRELEAALVPYCDG